MASLSDRVQHICGNAKYLKDHAYNITNRRDLQNIIDVVKESSAEVEQIVQVPPSLKDTSDHHGIKKQRVVQIKQHWQQLRAWKPGNDVIYNNNAAVLLFVDVSKLSRFLRGNRPTSDDEVHQCTDMYEKGQTAATDVLLGSAGSFSNWHQDGPLWSDSDVIVVEGSKFIAVVPVSRKAQAFISDIRGGRQKGQRAEHFLDKAWLAKVAAAGGVVARVTGPCALRIKAEHWHCVVNATTCVSLNTSYLPMADIPATVRRTGTHFHSAVSPCFATGLLQLLRKYQDHICGRLADPRQHAAALPAVQPWLVALRQLRAANRLEAPCGKGSRRKRAQQQAAAAGPRQPLYVQPEQLEAELAKLEEEVKAAAAQGGGGGQEVEEEVEEVSEQQHGEQGAGGAGGDEGASHSSEGKEEQAGCSSSGQQQQQQQQQQAVAACPGPPAGGLVAVEQGRSAAPDGSEGSSAAAAAAGYGQEGVAGTAAQPAAQPPAPSERSEPPAQPAAARVTRSRGAAAADGGGGAGQAGPAPGPASQEQGTAKQQPAGPTTSSQQGAARQQAAGSSRQHAQRHRTSPSHQRRQQRQQQQQQQQQPCEVVDLTGEEDQDSGPAAAAAGQGGGPAARRPRKRARALPATKPSDEVVDLTGCDDEEVEVVVL